MRLRHAEPAHANAPSTMPQFALSLLVALTAVLANCAPSHGANKEATAAAATNAATNAPASTGSAAGDMPHDSVSDAADRGRIMGDSTAKVWLVIVSDFQCPFCKQWHDESFAKIVDAYVKPGKIRVAYLNFPLNMHPHAQEAAEAAMCASVQGKFWQMQNALFGTQNAWAEKPSVSTTFDSLATSTGVSMPAWRQCVSSHATAALIAADRERTGRGGVRSTPTFFVGNRVVEGAQPYDIFRATIDSALAAPAKPSTH